MRLKRRADGDLEYYLVLIKIRLMILNHRKSKNKTSNIKFNIDKLRNESVVLRFQLGIKNSLNHNFAKQEKPEVKTT